MHPLHSHQLTITWNVITLRVTDEGLEAPQCRACRATLNVHQPDEIRPEHLLGTCALCGRWYLIEFGEEGTEAYLFDLPNLEEVRKAEAAAKPEMRRKSPPKPSAGESSRRKQGEHVA